MGYLIKDVKCKACGGAHDLFSADKEQISRNGRYLYICPDTNEESLYRRAGTDPVPAAKCPPGAITLDRSHRQL